jgi:DNA-directed RNA polymerase subunit beta'
MKKPKKFMANNHVPYGAFLRVKEGDKVEKDQEFVTGIHIMRLFLTEFDGTIKV